MKTINSHLAWVALLATTLTLTTACSPFIVVSSDQPVTYQNPDWAPDYYTGTRYYYFPDQEMYYDLSNSRFVYLYNGNWYFASSIPGIYSGFDPYNSFVVVVSSKVYEPWMHHQFYVSHYPKYYYRDYYDRSGIPFVRGYNENSTAAFYWDVNQRSRARSWNYDYVDNPRNFRYSNTDREVQKKYVNDRSSYDRNYRSRNSYDQNKRNNYNEPSRQDNTNNSSWNNRNNNGSRSTNGTTNNVNLQDNKGLTGSDRQNDTGRTSSTNSGNDRRPDAGNVNQNTDRGNNSANGNADNSTVNRNSGGNNGSTRTVTNNPTSGNNNNNAGTVNRASTDESSGRQTNYYGRTIGRPVKTEKNMTEPASSRTANTEKKAEKTSEKTSEKTNRDSSSSSSDRRR
jgi:hypothetical protein